MERCRIRFNGIRAYALNLYNTDFHLAFLKYLDEANNLLKANRMKRLGY